MKKRMIIAGVAVLIAAGGFLVWREVMNSFNQEKMQYENEKKSPLKRELDFSKYEEGISKITKEDIKEIDELTKEGSIKDIQKKIIDGDISCEKITYYYLNRIKKYDKDYNSIIQINLNAIDRAKMLDEKLKSGEKMGELFGAVLLIKDNIADKDMNTSTGAYALKDLTTKRDSFIVETLKKEDAIILGKANLSEWSNFMSMPSSNGFSVLGGQTKNAYGNYDVGGSSSGSSVSASLNFAFATLGSETSGSLIYPAGQNSVVALKPTLGLWSRDLIVPISEAQDTAGPIGRRVQDVFHIFKAGVKEDKNDPLSKNVNGFDLSQLKENLNKDYLKNKRIGILKEESKRYENLKKELISLGAEVIDVSLDNLNLDIDIMSVLNYGIKEDVKKFLNHKDVNSKLKSLDEVLKYNKEDEENRMPYGAKLHEDALKFEITEEKYNEIVNKNRKIAGSAIDNILQTNNIEAIASFSNDLSGIYAPAMYPAITVPAGYKESGEPFGATFVASLNDDYKLLNIAYSYEQATLQRKNPLK